MYSTVIQLSTKPIDKSDWFTEEQVLENIQATFGEISAMSVEILSDEERGRYIISQLIQSLPTDCFEVNPDGYLTFIGGLDKWVKTQYLPKIMETAQNINPERIFRFGLGSLYELGKIIKDPIGKEAIIITSNKSYYSSAMYSGDFISNLISYLNPGSNIYVGAIFRYYY